MDLNGTAANVWLFNLLEGRTKAMKVVIFGVLLLMVHRVSWQAGSVSCYRTQRVFLVLSQGLQFYP